MWHGRRQAPRLHNRAIATINNAKGSRDGFAGCASVAANSARRLASTDQKALTNNIFYGLMTMAMATSTGYITTYARKTGL
jgi:hypothetical protein